MADRRRIFDRADAAGPPANTHFVRKVFRARGLRVLGLIGIIFGGCSNDGSSKADRDAELRNQGIAVFGGTESSRAAASGGSQSAGGGWGILLESATGPDADRQARQRAAMVSQTLQRADVRIRTMPKGAAVILGSYAGPDDPRAQTDLEYIRSVQVQGQTPFRAAYLVPPPQAATDPGTMPQFSLENARREAGPGRLYTLQIAAYESNKPAEAKKAAEQAAAQLRRDGEMAFYHHGPNRSMVTIGIFGPQAADPVMGALSAEVSTIQKRFPNHLFNGRTVLVGGRPQESMLVEVPK